MLNKIIQTKEQEVKSLVLPPKQEVKRVSFYEALKNNKGKIRLIAEVKKASPSKGVIKENFNPLAIARAYERAGADAISVLTDEKYFQGSLAYLIEIKREVNIPVLRKDFIIDERQIEQSKRIGADAILLIAEALEPKKLHEFYENATEKGIDCLVEVHSEQSLENVLKEFTPKIIGVNNRDLSTFETTLQQTVNLAKMIPATSLFVSESGIHTSNDLEMVEKAGASAVLVGESLMRAESPEIGIKNLYQGLYNYEA